MGENINIWQYYFHPLSKYTIDDIRKGDDVKYVKKYRRTNPFTPSYTWDYQSKPPKKNMFYPSKESRLFVNNIIKKHVVVREYILKEVNDFFYQNMKGKVNLGVHIRPTTFTHDEVKYKHYFRYIDRVIKERAGNINLYLATDNPITIDVFKKIYKDILLHIDIKRTFNTDVPDVNIDRYLTTSSESSSGVWGADDAKGALIDCLLLSKCNHLVSGSSNLSTAATYFNPELEHIFLYNGKRYCNDK